MSQPAGSPKFIRSLPANEALPSRNGRFENLEANNVLNLLLWGLLVALTYYIAVRIGFALKPPHKATSAFWPPNAIMLAAFLVVPRKRWWILVLAVLPAHLLVQLPQGIPITTSLGWFLGNIGEGLLGAYLIGRFQSVPELFGHVRGLLTFLAFGVLAAPLLTSFIDAGSVIFTGWGQDFWQVWITRQLSNMLGELTVVPPVILFLFHGAEWFRKARWPAYLEALILGLVVVSAAIYVLTVGLSETGKDFSFYILLLLLAWATIRFRFAGLSVTLLAVTLIISWGVVNDRARFLASPNHVIPLQVFLLLVALPAMFIAVLMAQQREMAESLRASKIQLVNGQEQERSRIARELHDGIGQLIALVEIELTKLERECDCEMRRKLESLGQQVSEISRSTREISQGLHPSHLEYLGLSVALRKLCADLMKEQIPAINFHEAQVPEHLSPEVALAFYRVAQEALHNAAKYSGARRIEVCLRVKSGRLWLEIDDDGVGFTRDKASAGMGVMNMEERMQSIGGILTIKSASARGTQVHASIPLQNAA